MSRQRIGSLAEFGSLMEQLPVGAGPATTARREKVWAQVSAQRSMQGQPPIAAMDAGLKYIEELERSLLRDMEHGALSSLVVPSAAIKVPNLTPEVFIARRHQHNEQQLVIHHHHHHHHQQHQQHGVESHLLPPPAARGAVDLGHAPIQPPGFTNCADGNWLGFFADNRVPGAHVDAEVDKRLDDADTTAELTALRDETVRIFEALGPRMQDAANLDAYAGGVAAAPLGSFPPPPIDELRADYKKKHGLVYLAADDDDGQERLKQMEASRKREEKRLKQLKKALKGVVAWGEEELRMLDDIDPNTREMPAQKCRDSATTQTNY